jgi:hypothetical protein
VEFFINQYYFNHCKFPRYEDATEIYEATTYKNTSHTDLHPEPMMTRRCPKHPEVHIWGFTYDRLLGSDPTMVGISIELHSEILNFVVFG